MIDYVNLNAEYETLSQYTKQSMETVIKINITKILDFKPIKLF